MVNIKKKSSLPALWGKQTASSSIWMSREIT